MPIIDFAIQKAFKKIPNAIPRVTNRSVHQYRPTDLTECIFCREHVSPPPIAKMPTQMIRCGFTDGTTQCPHLFHIWCICKEHAVRGYNAQYLALEQMAGSLMCGDHYCTICFSDGFQSSAFRGAFVKDAIEMRAYHSQCEPIFSYRNPNRTINVYHYLDLPVFRGLHIPVCNLCGGKKDDTMKNCNSCAHSFHRSCFSRKSNYCARCCYDEQIGYEKTVLVEHNGLWRAAKTMRTVQVAPQDVVHLQLYATNELVDRKPEEICRVTPRTAYETYLTIEETYGTNRAERRILSEKMQEIESYSPPFPAPAQVLSTTYRVHDSMDKLLSARLQARIVTIDTHEVHPSVELFQTVTMGQGVRARRPIAINQDLCEYIGEVISKKEMEKRRALANPDDREGRHYIYETVLKIKNKNVEIGIDAVNHRNIAAFFNSSCEPNCETVQVEIEIGSVIFTRLILKTTRKIQQGEELFINYFWPDMLCGCGTRSCGNPKIREWDRGL